VGKRTVILHRGGNCVSHFMYTSTPQGLAYMGLPLMFVAPIFGSRPLSTRLEEPQSRREEEIGLVSEVDLILPTPCNTLVDLRRICKTLRNSPFLPPRSGCGTIPWLELSLRVHSLISSAWETCITCLLFIPMSCCCHVLHTSCGHLVCKRLRAGRLRLYIQRDHICIVDKRLYIWDNTGYPQVARADLRRTLSHCHRCRACLSHEHGPKHCEQSGCRLGRW
jgi:hypothetical protein